MEKWTIVEPSDGTYRLHINHGGKPYWCMFDFAVFPSPACAGVEIALADQADALSAEWFPYLHQGMQRGLETAREHGREWVAAGVAIHKVHTHPTDTNARGCQRYGFEFALEELPRRGIKLL